MWKASGYLSLLLATLGLFQLVHQGYSVGLALPVAMLMEAYAEAVDWALSLLYVDYYVILTLQRASDFLGIHLSLYPHWKYFLIPMLMYIGNSGAVTWSMGGGRVERKLSAICIWSYGGFLSLIASIFAGLFTISSSSLWPAMFPMIAAISTNMLVILWDASFGYSGKGAKSRSGLFWYFVKRDIGPAIALAAGCLAVGSLLSGMRVDSVAITTFLLFVFGLGCRSIVAGYVENRQHRPGEGMAGIRHSYVSASTRLGRSMLNAIGGTLIVLIANAGIKLTSALMMAANM